MCFELDSDPAIPVIRGAAVSHEDIVLTGADGTRFAAFLARPDESSAKEVVVLPTDARCTASTDGTLHI